MTAEPLNNAAGLEAPAGGRLWRDEMRATVKLALPIALTQLGQVAMMTSDLILIGRLGDVAIAGAALAHIILFVCFVLGMGLMSAVSPLAAQAYGAREPRMVRRALRVGLWAAVMIGAPLTVAMLGGETLLRALGQDETAARLAGQYLMGLSWCLVPGWWFIALRGFMGAVNRPEPALWIMLAAVPANLLLAYVLIFGEFGMPQLGMIGAGIATTIVNLGMCAACLWVCYTQRPFRKFQVLGRFWRMDWALTGKLFIIGLPIAGAFLLEYGLFAIAAILMGWIGTTALAAHQIALQIASILFMAPFGISMAATVRVGHAVGRRDPAGTRRAGFSAIALGAAFMAAMVVLILATRHVIPLAFLDANGADASATLALASTLLAAGSTFFIADGVQTIAAGALRGLNDTRVPLLFAALSFWGVGFGTSYGLAFAANLEAVGIWIGFTVGLGIYALLLVWRFNALTRHGYLPDLPGHAHA
ncbi:MATE family efflux transporter [Pseudolabrys sp. Root1462]|uniref:MATE family efflux transporter n=1 Tax=Pseudolabrys sp. Root1462 TaxID=1736466 RepID=UPI000702CD3D|nr:MATE family efflux transporter [Pseudolabrys sp. Root1462]KQZ01761.1 MATE family efflux transporter [Pseudolabrys sp. Root1462]